MTIALSKSLGKLAVDSAGMRSLTTATNASNRALERAGASAAVLERRLAGIRATAGGMGPIPALGGGRGGAGGNRGGGGGGGFGGRGGGGIHGGNIHLGPGGIGLGTAGFAAGDWFWPLAATGAAIYGGKALYESAKDLDTEQQRFRLLGMSNAQNQDAFKFVRDTKIYGTTQVERMAAFREAQGVGRESGLPGAKALDFAKLASPVLAKLDALGQGLDEESKSALHASNIALLRFDEQAGGLKSPEEFRRLANVGYKLRQSSGGTIDYEQLRAVTAKGGAYTQGMSEEGYAYAEPIIQELKGAAYGVGKSTAGNRLFNVMSRTPKNLVALANQLGLWKPGREHLDEADSQLFKESFEKFYIDRIMPIYAKLKLTANDRVRDNSILFGTTGARIANLTEKQVSSIQRSIGAFHKADSIEAAGEKLQKSLSGQELEFTAAWTDFKTNFGTTMLPFFSGLLRFGSKELRGASIAAQLTANKSPGAEAWDEIKNLFGGVSKYIGGGLRNAPNIYVQNTFDKRGIATMVSQEQAKAFKAPEIGLSISDMRQHLPPPGQ